MKIQWLGHASLLIQVSGRNIYVDPYAGEYSEKADVILITHGHRDHCDVEKIEAIQNSETLIITSSDCARNIEGKVCSMLPGETRKIFDVVVEAVEAYNFQRVRPSGDPFHPRGTQIGFIISAEGKRIYHAGDTEFIPEMAELEHIDIAFLPIMGRATMDLDEAVEAAIAINPTIAIPIHRRGVSEDEFKEKVEAKSNITVLTIKEGEILNLIP